MREEEELSIEVLCNLIQRELQNSLEDLEKIRERGLQAKRRCPLMKAALGNAGHYLGDLESKL